MSAFERSPHFSISLIMAHRETRERERERDRERDRVPGRREEERPARRDQREPRDSGRDGREPPRGLNEFFVDGEGIHREVMQREICKYLGPEAFCRPGTYNV